MPYEDVARLPHGRLGGGEVGRAAAQGAAGLGGGVPGLFQAAGLGRCSSSSGVLPEEVPQERGRLLDAGASSEERWAWSSRAWASRARLNASVRKASRR